MSHRDWLEVDKVLQSKDDDESFDNIACLLCSHFHLYIPAQGLKMKVFLYRLLLGHDCKLSLSKYTNKIKS